MAGELWEVSCPRRTHRTPHSLSPLHLLPAEPVQEQGAARPRDCGIKTAGAAHKDTPIPRIHIVPKAHTQHSGEDSAQVEAEIDASSEGMCCLLLAVTAGFPISSDACSLQERLEQPGN